MARGPGSQSAPWGNSTGERGVHEIGTVGAGGEWGTLVRGPDRQRYTPAKENIRVNEVKVILQENKTAVVYRRAWCCHTKESEVRGPSRRNAHGQHGEGQGRARAWGRPGGQLLRLCSGRFVVKPNVFMFGHVPLKTFE